MRFLLLITALWWGHVRPSVLVVGDSIALGVGQAMDVPTLAKIGASSCEIYTSLPSKITSATVIVSAGSNDPPGACLDKIRVSIPSRVIWILPVNEKARRHVLNIAVEMGDGVIEFQPGPDGVHPTQEGYDDMARRLKESLAS